MYTPTLFFGYIPTSSSWKQTNSGLRASLPQRKKGDPACTRVDQRVEEIIKAVLHDAISIAWSFAYQ